MTRFISYDKRTLGGFTIVELLIVIVVIGVLAGITVIAFNGIRSRAEATQFAAQLDQARKKVKLYQIENGSYPIAMSDAGVADGNGFTYTIASSGNNYCIGVTKSGQTYTMSGDSGSVTLGSCVAGSTNLALGANVSSSLPSSGRSTSAVTDGQTGTGDYFESDPGAGSVTVDLGSVQFIGRVVVWHYYGDPRSYNNNLIQISPNGSTWTTIFDSTTTGPFIENSSGHSISFMPTSVRYIRDSITGSSNNPGNHWVEIQAY